MEKLQRQVRSAHLRLTLQGLMRALTWCWFGTLSIAALLVGIDKAWPLGVEPWVIGVVALAVGLLVATIWTLATRRSRLEAAIEIDRRFGLKERVSSTLALSPVELATPAGKALAQDAMKRVESLHVPEKFGVRLSRWASLPLIPAVVAFAIAYFVNPVARDNKVNATTQAAQQKKQVKESAKALKKKIAKQREDAEKKGLKDAEEIFKKLEKGTKDLTEAKDTDRQKAMIKLNDLAQDLEKRRQQLGMNDKLKEQLNQLKDLREGPADKMADALKKGDLGAAMKEMKKLKDAMNNGKMDNDAKQKLTKQLDEMQKKLSQMADQHERQKEELTRKIAEKRAAGQKDEAEKLEQQLSKMSKQDSQAKQMKSLSKKLGQCAKAMQQGDQAGAAKAMDALKDQLNEMRQEMDEAEMLDAALDEIADAKDAMNCKDCGGKGCENCNGQMGRNGKGSGKKKGGKGMGKGRGEGDRPEEETPTGEYVTNVKQKYGKGSAVVTDLVDGPNIKGQVEQEIQTQFEDAKAQDADPTAEQALPRNIRDHAKEYFDALREGEKQ